MSQLINLCKLFKYSLRLNLIILSCLSYTLNSYSLDYLPKHLSPSAVAYATQTQNLRKIAFNKLIGATLGAEPHEYEMVAVISSNIKRYVQQNHGIIARKVDLKNRKKFTATNALFTGAILDELVPYVTTDLSPRPNFFYDKNLCSAALRTSGASIILGKRFELFSSAAQEFLVLQAIKSMTIGTPIITNYLSGFKLPGYNRGYSFSPAELTAYARAATHEADLSAACLNNRFLQGGLEALNNPDVEPLMHDDKHPSCKERINKLADFVGHQYYSAADLR